VEKLRGRIAEFVLDDLLFGDEGRMPTGGESLLECGVIDSTGILELIEFLEAEFSVHVEDDETVRENLDGIDRIAAYVARKRAASEL
jgi:acyl carrier protein